MSIQADGAGRRGRGRHDKPSAGTCGWQARQLRQGTFPLTPPETGDTPPAHGIDPAVLTARAEAGQPAGHKSQLGMRLPPPDWPPDSNGYRLYKQFN